MILDDVDVDWYQNSLIYRQVSFNLPIKFFRFKLLNCARKMSKEVIYVTKLHWYSLILFWTYCCKLVDCIYVTDHRVWLALSDIEAVNLLISEIPDWKYVFIQISKGFLWIKSPHKTCETIHSLINVIESLRKKMLHARKIWFYTLLSNRVLKERKKLR